MWKRRFYPLMNAAGEGGDPGGGAPAPAPAPAGGEGAPAPAPAPSGSLLETGANGAPTTDFIPEKYRVNKEDGTFDLEASSRKLSEAYANAEKRIGGGDIPPKSAEDYTVTVPDTFKESFDPKTDEGFKAFSGKMHELGLTQKQMDGVMAQYFEMAPQLVIGAAVLDANAAKTQLEQAWAPQGGFDHQIRNAYQGAAAIAAKAGIPVDEIMAPNGLGNNVQFLRMMAAIAPEFSEDTSSGGNTMGGASTEDQINEMMLSEAYKNPKHADHEKVSQRVKAFFEKKYGTAAVA
ncbi:hypothetical protein [Cupriavidus campinensis]|uniref:hypothetical protein n=1 Tax=Cupriavidus campinensis TaxID=151783 RepID=UPI0024E1FDB8|nr:hypothetical protein [Cupriavidus campinensis]